MSENFPAVVEAPPPEAVPVIDALRQHAERPAEGRVAKDRSGRVALVRVDLSTIPGAAITGAESLLVLLPDPTGKKRTGARKMFPQWGADLPGYGFSDKSVAAFNRWCDRQTDVRQLLDAIWGTQE